MQRREKTCQVRPCPGFVGIDVVTPFEDGTHVLNEFGTNTGTKVCCKADHNRVQRARSAWRGQGAVGCNTCLYLNSLE